MKNSSAPAGRAPHRDPAKEALWRGLLRQFAASGQTVREFCFARRLKESLFHFWRTEIQRRDGQAPARRQRSAPRRLAFAKVVVQPPAHSRADEAGLRLRLRGDRELLLPASWPLERVAALLRVIEGQPSVIEGQPSVIEGQPSTGDAA